MPKETTNFKLNDYIKKVAKKRYKSNLAFATACDIDEKTVRRIYSGKHNLSVKLLEKICEALEIKPSDMFREIGR
mgnify:CR=1 FL=1